MLSDYPKICKSGVLGNEVLIMDRTIRENTEAWEWERLSEYAAKADQSIGREYPEPDCHIRTAFQRDRDRIVHSKAFRRLKDKTQVFLSPEGDHYRTRLTHTLEVSQISRTIARALRLNEDLTEAIALGHDLGHTPFGHCGEDILNQIHPSGFEHNRQSIRVVEVLEKRGDHRRGLNLTEEVRDGILNHRGPDRPTTLEGQIVKLSDRIAYINHDIDDAIRAGVLTSEALPASAVDLFGRTHSERLNSMILDLVASSQGKNFISMSQEKQVGLMALREFMFQTVYTNSEAKRDEVKAQQILKALYIHFSENPDGMPQEYYQDYCEEHGIESVKDYLAGMSDRYAINLYKELFLPRYWI